MIQACKRGIMTGRRVILILALILSLALQAGAASLPLIIKIGSNTSIHAVAAVLGATVVDSIPGANTYLINASAMPSPVTASLLGIQVIEVNSGVTQPDFLPMGTVA